MTSSIPPTNHRRRPGGFTLVEMLVVIGIIIALLSILLPAIAIGYKHAVRNRMALDIQSVMSALEAYRNDMRDYPAIDYSDTTLFGANPPQTGAAYPGSVVLCRALLAPGTNADDGAGTPDATGSETNQPEQPGPGFRLLPNGKVYGPYLEPGRFKIIQDPQLKPVPLTVANSSNSTAPPPNDPHFFYLADRYGHPILYFRAYPAADIHSASSGFVNVWNSSMPASQRPYYNLNDGCGYGMPAGASSNPSPALWWAGANENSNANALKRMQLMLGDHNANGYIDPPSATTGSEAPVTLAPYLLWSAGPDENFGIDLTDSNGNLMTDNNALATRIPNCDDAVSWKQ